ncbi:MAG: YfhO family protein [bacterium]|nr:YfhO family protein [bacterium]
MDKEKWGKKKIADRQSRKQEIPDRVNSILPYKTDLWLLLIMLIIVIVLFHGIFSFDQTIVSSDFGVWSAKYFANQIRQFTWQKWLPYNHAGGDFSGQPIYPTHLLLFFMPPSFWLGFNYALHVFLLGVFMYCWMRYLKLSRTASFFAAISMMLTNHVVTLVYPGHMGKFDTFAWTPLTFLFLTKGVKEKKIQSFILAGCFFGLQFLGVEVQVAFYLGICLFIYLIYLLVSEFKQSKQIKPLLKSGAGFVIMAVVTAIFAAQVIFHFFGFLQSADVAWKKKNQENQAAVTATVEPKSEDETQSGYEFNISWSFPPEETLTFIMRRPFGDYSGAGGDKEYWGRLGSKQMTLKLTDDYLGIIPVIFAFLALWFVRKQGIWFWVILGLIALIFSFGGFTPIYKYVLLIPGMNKFRDPNKWIFIVTFCFATVTGYGMHWYANYISQPKAKNQLPDKKVSYFTTTIIILCIVCVLVMLIGIFFKEAIVSNITAKLAAHGSSLDYATVLTRAENVISSWTRMTVLLIIGVGLVIAGFQFQLKDKKEYPRYLLIAIITITACDLGFSASRFIQYIDTEQQYQLDPITAFLKSDNSYYRVKLYSRHPFLENLSNFKFKYYEIPAWDIAASRLPTLYNNFLLHIADKNFGTFLDVGNVKYMLGAQPLSHPAFRQVYTVGNFYVYEYLGFVPRVFTISSYELIPDENKVIERMQSPTFNVRNGVILESDPGFSSSTISDYNPNGAQIVEYTPNRVTVKCEVKTPSLLVFHDYYTPDWKAYLNGKPVKILKTNYLMRSVAVPAGSNTVVFKYEPNMIGLYISGLCLILFAGYLGYLGWNWWQYQKVKSI